MFLDCDINDFIFGNVKYDLPLFSKEILLYQKGFKISELGTISINTYFCKPKKIFGYFIKHIC